MMRMKYDGIEIIENTEESRKKFHSRGWVRDEYKLTKKEAEKLCRALMSGEKAIAFDDGEYTHIIFIEEEEGG